MVVLRLPHFSREIKCIGEEDVYVTKCQQGVKSWFARLYRREKKGKKKNLHKLLLHSFGSTSQVAGKGREWKSQPQEKGWPMQMPQYDFAMTFCQVFLKPELQHSEPQCRSVTALHPPACWGCWLCQAGTESRSLPLNLLLLSRAGMIALENFTGTDHCLWT